MNLLLTVTLTCDVEKLREATGERCSTPEDAVEALRDDFSWMKASGVKVQEIRIAGVTEGDYEPAK